MKRSFSFIICIILIALSACTASDTYADKEKITELVLDNTALFTNAVATDDYSEMEKKFSFITVSKFDNYVGFLCATKGISVSGTDYGFYFSKDDTPTGAFSWSPEAELKKDGNGYSSVGDDGGNKYYTVKICENFYYYEASF